MMDKEVLSVTDSAAMFQAQPRHKARDLWLSTSSPNSFSFFGNFLPARWATTSYKWSYSPYKWP